MINYGQDDIPEIDYGQNDESVAGTALLDPSVEEQRIKETLDLSEQYKIPPIETQKLVAGPEPSAFGKLLGKVKDLANEWILRPEQVGPEVERATRAGKEFARGGLAVSAEATSKLSLGALDVLTNKTVGDRSLADLVLRITDQRAMSPEEKAKAETLGYLPAFIMSGMAARKALSYVPAAQWLKTILGAGLTFGSTDLALQESRKLVTGEPIDWRGVHLQSGVGVLFGFGEVAVAAAMTGLSKGIEKYWGEKGIELADKIRSPGTSLKDQVARQEAEVQSEIARYKDTFKHEPTAEDLKFRDYMHDKYVRGNIPKDSSLTPPEPVKAETPAQANEKAPSLPVAGQTAETGAVEQGAEAKVLYHGTSAEKAEAIRTQGFKFGKQENEVSLSKEKSVAEFHGRKTGKKESTVLSVTLDKNAKIFTTKDIPTEMRKPSTTQTMLDTYARLNGYDGIDLAQLQEDGIIRVAKGKESEVVIFHPEVLSVQPAAEAKAERQPWEMTREEIEVKYPKADAIVDGRKVRSEIPNMGSIDSSLDNSSILPGIYEIPLSEFGLTGKHYSVEGTKRIDELAHAISQNKEINPLIVVIDKDGPYILEGATRAEALYKLGAKSFPAKVVLDEDSLYETTKKALAEGKPVPPAVLEEYKSEKWAQEALAKGEGEKAEGPARDILGGVEPIQQINKALKDAKEIRPVVEAERKAELKKRVGAAAGTLKSSLKKGKVSAEEAIGMSTGLLKGPLSNQRFESIRPIMEEASPGSVDNAFRSIGENPNLKYFEILDTKEAFQKLIDGVPITLRQVDLIKAHFGLEMGEIAKTRAEVSSLADRLWTLWRAGLLTGLKSWGPASINTLSNLAHGVTEVGKDYISAPADIVASWFTGKREVGLTVKGLPSGMKEGAQKGWDYLKTGIEERPIAEKFDIPRDKINFGDTKRGKIQQVYVDTIFHIYGAEDQPFFYGAMAHSIRSQAIASGRTKKLKGAELAKHIDDLVQKPTDDMLENAVADAEQAVFQNKTMLGDIAHAMQKVPIVRWFVPFSRTPSAVAMQIVNYTPVGMVKEIVEEIHNGKFNQRKFVQAFGRAGVGTGALFIGKLLFTAGLMTLSYPKNERERKLWELEGRKENSIKVGDKWRSVYTLGPVGNVLLIGGYFQQALEESGSPSEAIVTAMAGGAKSLTEQTFVTGMSQAIDAIKDPERSFDRFFSSMAGSAVPTIIADFAKATDEIERKPTGPWERIVSRLPGARQTLEPRVDVFGQDLPRYGGNPFEVMLDATRPSKIRQDVVVDEIRRLWDKDVRVAPTELGNRDGYKILTPEENTVLWRRAGQLTYRGLSDLIQQPYYKTLNDEAKGKQIEREVKKSKDFARAEVAKVKLNQGHTMEELRQDGLVIEDVERLISQFEIVRK